MKKIFSLFLDFLKFGCFTFGGGWAIIAQMQRVYVEEREWISNEEMLDLSSVGRSVPGVMISNIAMLFGYRMAGVVGGIACVMGMVIPPIVILSGLTWGYSYIRGNEWVIGAMSGVKAAIVPIIISGMAGMVKGAFRIPPCYLILVVSFVLYLFLNVNSVWIMVIGATLGLIFTEINERKETNK